MPFPTRQSPSSSLLSLIFMDDILSVKLDSVLPLPIMDDSVFSSDDQLTAGSPEPSLGPPSSRSLDKSESSEVFSHSFFSSPAYLELESGLPLSNMDTPALSSAGDDQLAAVGPSSEATTDDPPHGHHSTPETTHNPLPLENPIAATSGDENSSLASSQDGELTLEVYVSPDWQADSLSSSLPPLSPSSSSSLFPSSLATQPSTPTLSSSSSSTNPYPCVEYHVDTSDTVQQYDGPRDATPIPEDTFSPNLSDHHPATDEPEWAPQYPHEASHPPLTTPDFLLFDSLDGFTNEAILGIVPALTTIRRGSKSANTKRKRVDDDDDNLPSTSSKPPRKQRPQEARLRRSRNDEPQPSDPTRKPVRKFTTLTDGRVRCESTVLNSCRDIIKASGLSRHEHKHLAEEAGAFIQYGTIDVMSLAFVSARLLATLQRENGKDEVNGWTRFRFDWVSDNDWDKLCAALGVVNWELGALHGKDLDRYKAIAAFAAQWYMGELWTCSCLDPMDSEMKAYTRKDEVGTHHIKKVKESQGSRFEEWKHHAVTCWRAPWLKGGPKPLGL